MTDRDGKRDWELLRRSVVLYGCCCLSCASEEPAVFANTFDASAGDAEDADGGARHEPDGPPVTTEPDESCDAGSADATVCSCTLAQAVDLTGFQEVTIPFTNKYTPRCAKVAQGVAITWTGNFLAHPLWPSACAGDVADNPIHDIDDPTKTSLSILFPKAGTFPYYCPDHANDKPSPAGMCGVVYVVP